MKHQRKSIDHPGGITKLGAFDVEQEWLRTDRFSWFQEALARINPHLHLGWDRSNGRWCIIREDRVLRRGACGEVNVGFLARFHTLVLDICWKVEKEGGGYENHYRRPSEAILAKVARSNPRRFDFDNSEWAQGQLQAVGEAREAAQDAEVQEDLDGTWEEAAWYMDASSSTPAMKIRSAVPSNYEASKT